MTWIKMRAELYRHPKVVAICRLLEADIGFNAWAMPSGGSSQDFGYGVLRNVALGALLQVWSVSREHGKFVGNDLVLEHSTLLDLDEMCGVPGLSQAMAEVGWVIESPTGIGVTLPDFKTYNVPKTAAERMRDHRKQGSQTVTPPLRKPRNGSATKTSPTREEKRRLEESRGEETVNALSATPALNEKNTLLKLSALKFSPAEIFDMQAKYTPERIENVLDWWQGLAAGKKKGKPAAQVILATLARHSKRGEVTDLGMIETIIESKRANR